MVIWTPRARADLKAIHDYIANDSPVNAKKIVQGMTNKAETLMNLPNLGKVTPEMQDPLIREISAYSWRIIYHQRQRKIFVLTFVHKRRKLGRNDIF
ncbi:MAG: type II toxin-antitoxin system RelE/ParE family toxin [Candidatus Methylumidiphilus sp.]